MTTRNATAVCGEDQHTVESRDRYVVWLRGELEQLPATHTLRGEYQAQLELLSTPRPCDAG